MSERKIFEPIKEKIGIYKNKLVTVTYSTGHCVLFDMRGHYVDNFSWTQSDKIRFVGKLIKRRWRKQILTWVDCF